MNWFQASVLVALGFFICVYLVLVYLTSPRRPGRNSSRPRELHLVRDEELAEFVRNRMKLRPGLAGVSASVFEGKVRLTGRVGSTDDRELAGNLARSVPQVKSVINEVRVGMIRRESVA